MRVTTLLLALATPWLAACGGQTPAAPPDSGVEGTIHLGPQCPVVIAGEPCDDQPAGQATVTLSRSNPGDSSTAGRSVARSTTDADGHFRIAVAPGDYVVTATAGMSCEPMDAQVTAGAYTDVDIPCDTGIR